MHIDDIKSLLEKVSNKEISIDKAMEKLKHLPFQELGFATIDTHRHLRMGFPEVILGEGKKAEQIIAIIKKMVKIKNNILVTRLDEQKAKLIKRTIPKVKFDPVSRTLHLIIRPIKRVGKGTILIISAGTTDIPVAEESAITAEIMGNDVERLYDVGVAGIHRLISKKNKLLDSRVIIVVAGMEGALASVVGGLVDKPIIAVPTSVGYGASFGGITSLLGMLNACVPSVTVVNIDNGFGAGYVASLINRL